MSFEAIINFSSSKWLLNYLQLQHGPGLDRLCQLLLHGKLDQQGGGAPVVEHLEESLGRRTGEKWNHMRACIHTVLVEKGTHAPSQRFQRWRLGEGECVVRLGAGGRL